MKLTIKNRFLFYAVLDENKQMVCKIKSKNFWGPEKEIICPRKGMVYTTDIINTLRPRDSQNMEEPRKYIVYRGMDKSKTAIIASLAYSANDADNKGSRFLFKLPQVSKLKIQSIYGEFDINRLKGNALEIRDKLKPIGAITNLFTFRNRSISCDTIEDGTFLAALYVLAAYMIHEDDLIVV